MEETPITTQSDKIKLIRNSRGYSWEISILSHDIDELERLNSEMKERFGNDET